MEGRTSVSIQLSKRSRGARKILDCFVALAPRNGDMGVPRISDARGRAADRLDHRRRARLPSAGDIEAAAVGDRGKQDRAADCEPGGRLRASSLAAMWPWSCSMTTKASTRLVEHVSQPNGPATSMPACRASSIAGPIISISSRPNRPPSPACGLRPLTQMFGIATPRRLSAVSVARTTWPTRSPRYQRQRFARRRDARWHARCAVTETQHQIDVVAASAGLARDERGIAVEGDPGRGDRCLVLRRGDHASTSPASAALIAALALIRVALP